MKTNRIAYRAALLCLLTLAAACSHDDDFPSPGENGAATSALLTISVVDGAYTAADASKEAGPATRAAERAYGTEFTAGDRIGLYRVTITDYGSAFILDNFPATFNGERWEISSKYADILKYSTLGYELYYFAYYPYIPTGLEFSADNLDSASAFFAEGISNWVLNRNQSKYEYYTGSDLMVAKGVVTKRTDGDGSVLRFTMEHQMALAVVRVPSTKCTYSETIGGQPVEKNYRIHSGMNLKNCWQEDDCTARYLVHPKANPVQLNGVYYNSAREKRTFTVESSFLKDKPGTYRLYTVDGGRETVRRDRPLREGDFYMSDGTVLPQENFPGDMPDDLRKECLGVVFWVGEKEGMHWTHTGSGKGDRLLMRDHPECNRGMVVALHDASNAAAWATGSATRETLHTWADNFDGFTDEEQAAWQMIKLSDEAYGYRTKHLAELYARHNPEAGFPACEAVRTYAATHSEPEGCSGWFVPGSREFAALTFGVPDNYDSSKVEMMPEINPQIAKAGGTGVNGEYWALWESVSTAWRIRCDPYAYDFQPKSNAYKVRAVLVF